MSGSNFDPGSNRQPSAPAVVLTTAGDLGEARSLAHSLVDERLAGCVQLVESMRSVYRWQGEIAEDTEVLLLIKTRRELFPTLSQRIRELHSYDTPEIVLLEAEAEQVYGRWLAEATGGTTTGG